MSVTGGQMILLANMFLKLSGTSLLELSEEDQTKWLGLAEEALHHLDAEGEFEYNIQGTRKVSDVYYLYPDWCTEKGLADLKESMNYIRGDSSGRTTYKLVKRPVAGRVTDA